MGITGLLQILLKKGGKFHRTIGLLYCWAWLVVIITGTAIGSIFISLLGILGLYMVITGYRFGHFKTSETKAIDKAIIYGGVVIAALLLLSGPILYFIGRSQTLAIICFYFGAIFFITTFQDLQVFVSKSRKKRTTGYKTEWYFEHFGRMYISYIAAITAFSAIQNIFGIALVNWISPTVIGTALIVFTNQKYYQKFKIPKRKS